MINTTNARPICDVCNKEVEEISATYDPITCITTFVVLCHGDRETVAISDNTTREAKRITFGRAFVKRRLADGPKLLEEKK